MKHKMIPKLITILIPFLLILLFILKDYVIGLLPFIPPCPFYTIFHLYCPACGNTRSVLALLRGDVLTSIRYNITPVLLIFLSSMLYIELATYSFGRHKRLLSRRFCIYLTGMILLFLYLIIRNFIPYLTP